MNGDLIRQTFLDFFQSRGHTIMPSSSLVPAGDPTLLFTSAGMVPFKPFFMGEATPPSHRLTSCQKSFRTTDVDEVGDHKHLTFFEMLGNFSIGDYFKKDAIAWSWEFVTQYFKLPEERLYVTIYLDDEEAFQHWREDIGVPSERIYRYGDKDNWWGPAGKEGPCGPCSEIHYDGGVEYGCGTPDCHPNHDCERFVELWNLVFMQFYQDLEGNRTPLPAPSIDTGLGLERAAAILQGKRNLYETDLFWPIIQRVCQLTGKTYGEDSDTDYALRVVAEHSRAAAFLIADGVVPSGKERGSVLRHIIRRAITYGHRLGLDGPFLTQVAEAAIQRFQHAYPELSTNRDFILRVVRLEEERFALTLGQGLSILDKVKELSRRFWDCLEELKEIFEPNIMLAEERPDRALDALKSILHNLDIKLTFPLITPFEPPLDRAERGALRLQDEYVRTPLEPWITKYQEDSIVSDISEIEALKRDFIETERRMRTLSGQLTFTLGATYGFPPELTQEIAREFRLLDKTTFGIDEAWERGLEVDMEGYEQEKESHREASRAAYAFTGAMEMLPTYENLGVGRVEFVGYEALSQQSVVTALLVDPSAGSGQAQVPVGHATKGQSVEVVLEGTPFYAEGGGQVGDAGIITGPNGRVRVEDTQAPIAGLIVHRGVVEAGDISLGDPVDASVDLLRRLDTARNHSGTHLLHASLRQVLGPHVRQAGSLVASDRLRFDYSHVSPLSRDELQDIQGLANQKVRDNLEVRTRESSFSQAVQEGALAFFGDRYGDVIRVVEMSNGERFSLEVCGGTHVEATGEVGPLFVVGESSIGGGMRRVEAVTGRAAEQLFVERSSLLESFSQKLQTPLVDLETRLDSFIQDAERLRKRVEALERGNLRREAQEILLRVQDVDGMNVVAEKTSASNVEGMREMGDWLKSRLSSAVIVLAAVENNRPTVIAMVTPDLVAKGFHAGDIVRETARVMEGGGGGRPEMAQAGGKRADKLDEALGRVPEVVRKSLP